MPPPPATMTRAPLRFSLRGSMCRSMSFKASTVSSSSTASWTISPGAGQVGLAQRHHALADGGHLRPAVVVDDRGDDVAAEGGADLQQQVLVRPLGLRVGDVADVQVGAIGRHARLDRRGHARGQVAAHRRRPVEHDLRAVLLDERAEHAGVGVGLEMGQPGVVGRVDRVDALGDQLAGHVLDVVAGQHGAGLHAQPHAQFRGLAAEFQRHVVQRRRLPVPRRPKLRPVDSVQS